LKAAATLQLMVASKFQDKQAANYQDSQLSQIATKTLNCMHHLKGDMRGNYGNKHGGSVK